MDNKLVILEKISKRYQIGDNIVNALTDITMSIYTNDFVSIMGVSGSGKSTLLHIIGCADNPSSGEYFLEGTDVSALDDYMLSKVRNSKIGFVFQAYNLIPHLNVIENIEIPLFYLRRRKREQREKSIYYAGLMGLKDRLYHKPAELSGGQQQRVAIARALVNEPLLILADEPTGNLDSKSSYEIMKILSDLNSEGKTIVMVTHDSEIAGSAKKIIRIHDGRIVSS